MNADQTTTPTPPTPPLQNPPVPAPGAAPAAPHDFHNTQPLIDPDNALVRFFKSVYQHIKTGQLGSPKLLGLILLFVLAIGLGWWFLSQRSRGTSARWAAFSKADSTADWEQLAKGDPGSITAKLARLEQARVLATTEGTDKLIIVKKKVEREQCIGNIEAARAEFLKLADEFKSDNTLKAQCLSDAAETEKALVGWPKEGVTSLTDNPESFRGQVTKAAEYYRKAAEAIGTKTVAGEMYTKRADELEAKKAEVLQVQRSLYDHLSIWEPVILPITPKDPPKENPANPPMTDTTPKGPEKPLDPKTEPIPKPNEPGPKGPEKPLEPPAPIAPPKTPPIEIPKAPEPKTPEPKK